MESTKFYKEKATGKYLGRFNFAFADEPEGRGRGRVGTLYYFMPDNSTQWKYPVGIKRRYAENFDIANPPLPDDIEEVQQSGGKRKSRRRGSKSKKNRHSRRN